MESDREELLTRLKARAVEYACANYLAGLAALNRAEVYTSLVFDRLKRKMRLVEQLFIEASEDWNQTFYMLYLRTLGDLKNQQAYLELSQRVPYRIVLRERENPYAVEALLMGASGLLNDFRHDDYTEKLAETFSYLAAKYEIEPMSSDVWNLADMRPANHPILRMAEAAAFFRQDDFVADRTLGCRTADDIYRIFGVEASEYWRTTHLSGLPVSDQPRRIGRFKSHIIGINLVAIYQFAYGSYIGDDGLRDRALTLLERLAAERNRYITAWCSAAVLKPANAFETQALLQLATEYCARTRCAVCPVGQRIIASVG
ncbi:MAG: DUF2851 family protein [Rikenellaceae bacterium]|nr:DUF2851 family protein [Rikenellaceae bacterium]